MELTYILVDFENVQPQDLDLLQGQQYRVKVFHGAHQNKLDMTMVKALQPLGEHVEYLQSEKPGKNALDFHVAFCMGRLLQTHMSNGVPARFGVVSRDGGFDSLLRHMRSLVSLPMLAVLKLLAWQDRHLLAPGKDATDLMLIPGRYLNAGNADRLYGEMAYLLTDNFDFERTGAWLAGKDASTVLQRHSSRAEWVIRSMAEILSRELAAARISRRLPVSFRQSFPGWWLPSLPAVRSSLANCHCPPRPWRRAPADACLPSSVSSRVLAGASRTDNLALPRCVP